MTRRRIYILLSVTAGVVVIAVVAATVLTVWSIRRPYPEYDGTAEVPRLSAEVEVVRDANGIPHIYADTAEDLFRGQGYVHAQDRFWQMDFRRHVTSGRVAELFGSDYVETDAFVRTLGWRQVAKKELPLLEPETRRYLQAYADGVNAWLDENSGGELGFSYTLLGLLGRDTSVERWTAVDSLAWLKAMAWDLRGNIVDEVDRALLAADLPAERIEQLYPDDDADVGAPIVDDQYLTTGGGSQAPPIVGADGEPIARQAGDAMRDTASALRSAPALMGDGPGIGSNSWVVDGSKTESGAPLLANDPHLGPTLPSVWYQVGLHCRDVGPDCPFDVTGFSFSGVPGVVIGHNTEIAWGFTNLGADVTDLYLEDVEGDLYRVGEEWRPMDTREETIKVAGEDDVTITVRSTRHGPLLSDHSDQMRDVGRAAPVDDDAAARDDGSGADAGTGADAGADADDDAVEGGDDGATAAEDTERAAEFEVALRWTALDPGRTADAIFALNKAENWDSFRAAAALFEVPAQNLVYADVRGNIGYQAPGKIPVRSAGDGRYPVPGWTGEYDWDGYIPFDQLPRVLNPDDGVIVTANQPVTSDAYPYLLTDDFSYGHRAGRIRQLLDEATAEDATVGVDTMAEIQMDTYSAAAEVLVPYLLELDAPAEYYGDGLRMLRDWDFLQQPESGAAAYFNAVWRHVLKLTFHDELPEDQWPDGGGRWFEVMRDLLDAPEDQFWDDADTDPIETRDDILMRAAEDARDELTRMQGKDTDMWEWGRSHTLTPTEETFGTSGYGIVERLFNRGPVATGGGASTVQANGWTAADGYEVDWVPSMRMIVDLGELDNSRWIDLTGVSGHPYHAHYGDQTELWRSGETLPMRSEEEDIRAAGEHTFRLVPRDPVSPS